MALKRPIGPVLVVTILLLAGLPLGALAADERPPDGHPRASNAPEIADIDYEIRGTQWIGEVSEVSAPDADHMFFLSGSHLYLWDIPANGTKDVQNVTYPDPINIGEWLPSELVTLRASKLADGNYNLAILERQQAVSGMNQSLLMMIVSHNGTVVHWERPFGNGNIVDFDIERNLCMAIEFQDPNQREDMVFWNRSGDGQYWPHTDDIGQGSGKELISVAYNETGDYYDIARTYVGGGAIGNSMIEGDGYGGGMSSEPIAWIEDGWKILDMESAFVVDNGTYRRAYMVLERNTTDETRRIEGFRDSTYVNLDHFVVADEKGNALRTSKGTKLMIEAYTKMDLAGSNGLMVMMFTTVPEGGGGNPSPEDLTFVFTFYDGTIVGNFTYVRDAAHRMTALSTGFDFYAGGNWCTSGASYPPYFDLYIDRIGPRFVGDWAIDMAQVEPDKALHTKGKNVTVDFLPASKMERLDPGWMIGARASLLDNGTEVPSMNRTVSPGKAHPIMNFTWVADLGSHNLTVSIRPDLDTDWSNNNRSLTVNCGLPDLVVSNLTASPNPAKYGAPIGFSFHVKNIGADADSAMLVVYERTSLAWDQQMTNLGHGFEMDVHGNLTGNVHGAINLTAKAIPVDIGDGNLTNNSVNITLTVYYEGLEVFIDSPEANATVNHQLHVQGRVEDQEEDNVDVWADLTGVGPKLVSEHNRTNGSFALTLDIKDTMAGRYTLTVHANGTYGRTARAEIKVDVKNGLYWELMEPVNQSLDMDEGGVLELTAIAADWGTLGHVPVTWAMDDGPITGLPNVSIRNDTLRFAPSYNDSGEHIFIARATGRFGETIVLHWNVNVTDVNRPPQVRSLYPTNTDLTINTSAVQNFSVDAFDPDGDLLTIRWSFDNKTYIGSNVSLMTTTPGRYPVVLTLSDGHANLTHTWDLKVLAVNKTKPPKPVRPTVTVESPFFIFIILLIVIVVVVSMVAHFAREDPKKKKSKGPTKAPSGPKGKRGRPPKVQDDDS